MTSKQLLSEAAQQLINDHRAEQQLEELTAAAPVFQSKAAAKAAAGRKPPYTPEALVQLMIDHPEYTHSEFAEAFGYKASWFAGVLVSDRFQKVLEPRRHEVSNPALTGTMQDMFQAMTVQAVVVLQARLENPQASEDLIIKAITAGTKALGMGTPGALPPPPQQRPSLTDLAARLSVPKLIEATPARDFTIDNALGELPR